MDRLLKKYPDKMAAQRLVEPGEALIGVLDADIAWNRDSADIPALEEVISSLNINSMLFARPAEPYFSILNSLGEKCAGDGCIRPGDSETRTFLHDIPVIGSFDPRGIAGALKRRKTVYVIGRGIVTYGTVSPEQAFVHFSSVCFATFVKFCADSLHLVRSGKLPAGDTDLLRRAVDWYARSLDASLYLPPLASGPFSGTDGVIAAIIEAGERTVSCGLVDSFFGNISCLHNGVIYISQTGSSLDELAGMIDPCPVDGSTCAAITASSEFGAHREIYARTGASTILHGHPKFSVILSLQCERDDCPERGECHRKCPEKRFIGDIPVVPGEVGTGPYGISRTLPPAMPGRRGVIVYGHGLFTAGRADFTDAFVNLLGIERMCLDMFQREI